MNYADMNPSQRQASYRILGALARKVADLDRSGAGQHNILALTFAYSQVESLIEQEQIDLFDSYPPETD
ncbi:MULTISPECIES: hypothetical protein [unclassified Glutamicibacter]|uniref:hypothetical protein n=1 Tax=unclassified Glutamicibacter TaxID=2627139 RepID=UPI003800B9E1